jgi:hypothetical protein
MGAPWISQKPLLRFLPNGKTQLASEERMIDRPRSSLAKPELYSMAQTFEKL